MRSPPLSRRTPCNGRSSAICTNTHRRSDDRVTTCARPCSLRWSRGDDARARRKQNSYARGQRGAQGWAARQRCMRLQLFRPFQCAQEVNQRVQLLPHSVGALFAKPLANSSLSTLPKRECLVQFALSSGRQKNEPHTGVVGRPGYSQQASDLEGVEVPRHGRWIHGEHLGDRTHRRTLLTELSGRDEQRHL